MLLLELAYLWELLLTILTFFANDLKVFCDVRDLPGDVLYRPPKIISLGQNYFRISFLDRISNSDAGPDVLVFAATIQLALCFFMVYQRYDEYEVWPFAVVWVADDFAVEHVYNLFGYVEAKADAFGIYLLCRFDETKQFEQLRLVFLFDAKACVLDLNLKELCLNVICLLGFNLLNDFYERIVSNL